MRKIIKIMVVAALAVVAMAFATSCTPEHDLTVSTYDLLFSEEEQTLTIDVSANCKWTVGLSDDEDWYTVTPMSGKNNGVITVSVKPMTDTDYRGTFIVVRSPGSHIRRTIFISQSKLDFSGMMNKVFGVTSVEHWNTDFFGQMVEDSYKHFEYNPYDTTTGYTMYFLADGTGVQMDHQKDTAVYYVFNYEYDPINQILHIEFETIDDAPENYDPQVLTASDSLFRFMHEYKDHWWERADMRKIGIIHPDAKDVFKHKAIKRKGGESIFMED